MWEKEDVLLHCLSRSPDPRGQVLCCPRTAIALLQGLKKKGNEAPQKEVPNVTFFLVLGMELRALHMLSVGFITEL